MSENVTELRRHQSFRGDKRELPEERMRRNRAGVKGIKKEGCSEHKGKFSGPGSSLSGPARGCSTA